MLTYKYIDSAWSTDALSASCRQIHAELRDWRKNRENWIMQTIARRCTSNGKLFVMNRPNRGTPVRHVTRGIVCSSLLMKSFPAVQHVTMDLYVSIYIGPGQPDTLDTMLLGLGQFK